MIVPKNMYIYIVTTSFTIYKKRGQKKKS